jgi:uncharacterized protein (DUF2236 family)
VSIRGSPPLKTQDIFPVAAISVTEWGIWGRLSCVFRWRGGTPAENCGVPATRKILRITDVSADAILLAGGARAILLQLANPAVAEGVAAHSDFAAHPLDRLRGTLTYLYVMVYGTDDERRTSARQVGLAHRAVESATYSARDPQLQLWVAATLYETAMRMRKLAWGPLNRADRTSLLNDYAIVGTALGLPADEWPSTPEAFDAYWDARLGILSVSPSARRVADELLHSRAVPLWMRALLPAVRTVTAGMLPEPLRDAYGLELNERAFARFAWFARTVYPRLPRIVRHAPQRHYLRAFRRSIRHES